MALTFSPPSFLRAFAIQALSYLAWWGFFFFRKKLIGDNACYIICLCEAGAVRRSVFQQV